MAWTRGSTIGKGSSATVSVAIDNNSGDIFAVKSAELSQSKSLQREQKILSSLCSPHIVSYKGCDISRENSKLMYNLFMEYAPGGTLNDTIRKRGNKLDETEIVRYTKGILQGLEYLRSHGIAHCDIKGQNILIGQDGAKIADFGCAKRVDEAVVEAPIGGTPMFMSPEVARGEEQGCPCDIWALGCTIIEMSTGKSPWSFPNALDPVSLLYRIANSGESPEIPDFLSPQGQDFLSNCLRIDPKERWSASQLLDHPFINEFDSKPNSRILDSYSNSPTSTLDQGIWSNELEETEIAINVVKSKSEFSDAHVGFLSCSFMPKWSDDENWLTIRERENAAIIMEEEEDGGICDFGGPYTMISIGFEEMENSVGSECLNNLLLASNVSTDSKNEGIVHKCACTVYNNFNLECHENELILLRSCFL